RYTCATQITKEPAGQRFSRLIPFQRAINNRVHPTARSILTTAPPPRQRPLWRTTARSANNSRLGYESASTNTSQSPVATEAPLLHAREIWFIRSNTTAAPAA